MTERAKISSFDQKWQILIYYGLFYSLYHVDDGIDWQDIKCKLGIKAELRQNDRRYNLEATNNIYLPGGRRVRGFVGIEPLVHPCP